jgi:TonB-linked SusC/RagA family outer membrane protein
MMTRCGWSRRRVYGVVAASVAIVAGRLPAASPMRGAPVAAELWMLSVAPGPARGTDQSADSIVAGVVIDAQSRQPLDVVRIGAAGAGAGAVTGPDGTFRLTGVHGDSVRIEATRIGYSPVARTVRVGDTAIRIVLTATGVDLNAVVVTGTAGPTDKRSVANAISTIDAEDVVKSSPIYDPEQLIDGQAAGALVQIGTGQVGGGGRITLRGSASMSLGNQPLIYINGVRVDNDEGSGPSNGSSGGEISRLNDIDPDQIQSIEIIKGPAAATLYGTEASNGVIQIITKRGEAGQPLTWNLTARAGATWFQNPAGRIPLAYGKDSTGDIISINPYDLATSQDGQASFHTAYQQASSLSASGGMSKVRYFVSGEVQSDAGIQSSTGAQNERARVNVDLAPSSAWHVSLDLAYVAGQTDLPSDGIFGGALWALEDETPSTLSSPRSGWVFGSPMQWENEFSFSQGIQRTTIGGTVTYTPTDWFQQRLTLGSDKADESNVQTYANIPAYANIFGGFLSSGYRQLNNGTALLNTADWSATLTAWAHSSLHAISSVGAQYYYKGLDSLLLDGFPFPVPGTSTVSAGATRDAGEDIVENKTAGVWGQEELALNNRLFLDGGLRVDNNSAFGRDFKWVVYPKAGLSWVVSDEPFWHVGAINQLRLRTAYGETGQQPDAFAALQTHLPVSGGYGTAVTNNTIGNPDLKPERGKEWEAGFDGQALDKRLDAEFTWYHKATTDGIFARQLPPSGGYPGTEFVNVGALTNTGVEVLLRGRLLTTRSVAADIAVNYAHNNNIVQNVGNASGVIPLSWIGGASGQELANGYPVGAFFGQKVVSASLSPSGQATNILCADGKGGAMSCANAPLVYLGRSVPTDFGSVTPSITLGGRLQLLAQVDYQLGFMKDNTALTNACFNNACEMNFYPQRFDPRKVADFQIAAIPAFDLASAGFAKLRQISANYDMPLRAARLLRAKRMILSIAARNLVTWTKFPGLDPESSNPGLQFVTQNVSLLPTLAVIQTRVNLTY